MSPSNEPFDPYYHWLGIPPDEQPATHYRLLGIQLLESNREVIQNAADRQMAHLRTFQSGPHGALSQKLLNEVSAARVCLLSDEKKAQYDAQLPLRHTAAVPVIQPPAAPAARVAAAPVETGLGLPQTARPARVRGRRHVVSRFVSLLVLLACALIVVVLGVGLYHLLSGPSRTAGQLVLHWPQAARSGVTLEIDGRPVDLRAAITTAETVEVPLEPGEHAYRISGPEAAPITGDFRIESGQHVELDVIVPRRRQQATVEEVPLIVLWPESDRAGGHLEIDGRVVDLQAATVNVTGERIELKVRPGRHRVALLVGGNREREVVVQAPGEPVAIMDSGRIELVLHALHRDGLAILLNGEAVDATGASVTADDKSLEFRVPAGRHTVRVLQGEETLLEQSFLIVPGGARRVDVDRELGRNGARVVLRWLVSEQSNASLEIDGEVYPADRLGKYAELPLRLAEGPHTIRIVRPGYETFEQTADLRVGEQRVVVVNMRPIGSQSVSPEEIVRLRDQFVKSYTQHQEFRDWTQESEPQRKRARLLSWLGVLISEVMRLPGGSGEQFVAFDEVFRLAKDQQELATADDVLQRMRAHHCIDAAEFEQRQKELRESAINVVDFDQALRYLNQQVRRGQPITEQEQIQLASRMEASPAVKERYEDVARTVDLLKEAEVLDEPRAHGLLAAIYARASREAALDSAANLELAERMVQLAARLLGSGQADPTAHAQKLVGAAEDCRRRVLADRQLTAGLRPRLDRLKTAIEQTDEHVEHLQRVLEARQAVESGTAAAAQQKLVGLWLLEQARYDEALPHLRASNDPALEQVSIALPDSGADLADLADALETEAKKTKYNERAEQALLGYANHIRQLAETSTSTPVTSPASPTESAAPVPAEWRTLPRGRWQALFDVVSAQTLQQAAAHAGGEDRGWSVSEQASATLATIRPGVNKLEVPLRLEGSYAVRYRCQAQQHGVCGVVLPLGPRSVLFSVGAANGLELVDGRPASDAQNAGAIPQSRFGFRAGVPIAVEIHVDDMPAARQSTKERRVSGGVDWVTISVRLNNVPAGVLSGPYDLFAVPPLYELAPGMLGFVADGPVQFGDIAIMRK